MLLPLKGALRLTQPDEAAFPQPVRPRLGENDGDWRLAALLPIFHSNQAAEQRIFPPGNAWAGYSPSLHRFVRGAWLAGYLGQELDHQTR